MDGIAVFEPSLVIGISAVSGKLAPVLAIEVGKGPADGIPRCIIGHRLEEPTAHDGEALLGVGWLPYGLDAPKGIADAL